MATRSRIGVVQKDGKVISIYCHNDGYCSGVGDDLFRYHNTEEKANQLMGLGDISSLHESLVPLVEAPARMHWDNSKPAPMIPADKHHFDNPQAGVTVAYHRDRAEPFRRQTHDNIDDYNQHASFESYNYLFKDSRWFVMDRYHSKAFNWIELTEEIVENDLPEIA